MFWALLTLWSDTRFHWMDPLFNFKQINSNNPCRISVSETNYTLSKNPQWLWKYEMDVFFKSNILFIWEFQHCTESRIWVIKFTVMWLFFAKYFHWDSSILFCLLHLLRNGIWWEFLHIPFYICILFVSWLVV